MDKVVDSGSSIKSYHKPYTIDWSSNSWYPPLLLRFLDIYLPMDVCITGHLTVLTTQPPPPPRPIIRSDCHDISKKKLLKVTINRNNTINTHSRNSTQFRCCGWHPSLFPPEREVRYSCVGPTLSNTHIVLGTGRKRVSHICRISSGEYHALTNTMLLAYKRQLAAIPKAKQAVRRGCLWSAVRRNSRSYPLTYPFPLCHSNNSRYDHHSVTMYLNYKGIVV